jgi:hypothetical protein
LIGRTIGIIVILLVGLPPVKAADTYAIAHGTAQNITEHGVCRKVTNNHAAGLPIMVPTKSSTEWASFYNASMAGITLQDCADPCRTGPVGTVCADGSIYAGSTGGRRNYLYMPDGFWFGMEYWRKFSRQDAIESTPGTSSTTDGLANTNAMFTHPKGPQHLAAGLCRSLGPQWYLPAIDELRTIYNNLEHLSAANYIMPYARYLSSTEHDASRAKALYFMDGSEYLTEKEYPSEVMCIRIDYPEDTTPPVWHTAPTLPPGGLAPYPAVSDEDGIVHVAATDETSGLIYSAQGPMPSFLKINAGTGSLTPTGSFTNFNAPDTAGIYEFVIRATDASGNYADRQFSITIHAPGVACSSLKVPGCVAPDGAYYMGYYYFTGDIYVAPADETVKLRWKTTLTATSGTGDPWLGLKNTNAMITAGAASHPAAAACRARGAAWYLPADRLMDRYLYPSRRAIGGMKSTNVDYYWSSTERSAANADAFVATGTGNTMREKTNAYYVRCVRD